MRVLVTGANGWVGQAVRATAGRDDQVRYLDRVESSVPGLDWHAGDLADIEVARRAVDGVDAIIHLAAGTGFTPRERLEGAVTATTNLFEAAVERGVTRVVLMSSGVVVTGYPRTTWIDARTTPRFTGIYGLAKWLQEEVARHYSREFGITVPILRPWVIVDASTGRRSDGEMREEPDPYGHNGAFGWVDRYDVADAAWLAVTAPVSGAPVYHLMPSRLAAGLFDVDAARTELGWSARHDFEEWIPAGVLPLQGHPA
jgi:nucleoside-diphosphate-sugar epimerase